jgi:ribosomal protein S18 acetylase RimI-like enzyme
MTQSTIVIAPVESGADRTDLRTLLGEYHDWLRDHVPQDHDPDAGRRTDRQSLAEESESWAWIGRKDGDPAGCVLLYGETDSLAEFRRLWVRPAYRGHGIGRRLTRTVTDEARARGYETLGLTTPPAGTAAHALYESLGFERTPPYPETRLDEAYHDDAIFMQLDLTDERRGPPRG